MTEYTANIALQVTSAGPRWTDKGRGHRRPSAFFRVLYRLTGWGL